MPAQNVRYHAVLGLLVAAGFAGVSHAQNAVGDGRALEAPLQTWGPGVVSRPRTFSSELAFRESIVTGTAPSGLSFRGDALPSQFEFRGELAEDALFAYRRDSLFSGLAGRGIRGTDALQYQLALTVGARVPSTLAGRISYARAGAAERGGDFDQPLERDLTGAGGGLRQVTPEEDLMLLAIEAGASLVQPVRSVSSFTANHSLQPTLVGLMQNRVTHQSAGQTASPLLGVQVVPVDTLRNPGAGQVPDSFLTPPGTGVDLTVPGVEPLPSSPIKPAYEQLLERYKNLYGPDASTPSAEGEAPQWAKDLVSIQRALRGLPPPRVRPGPVTPGAPEDPDLPGVAGDEIPGAVDIPEIQPFEPEVLRRVREAGGLTDSLIPTNLAQVDRYSAYMRTGQEMLAAERYFDAEEVFITALTARPRDVNASVGRAHAQLGAGLYLSAALNIRQLLVLHPEVSGMRYAPDLLPGTERMRQVAAALRQSLSGANTGADSGLLLAYLGFQRGIEQDIRDGLDALEAQGDEADHRLVEMLRTVWLDAGDESADDSASDDG